MQPEPEPRATTKTGLPAGTSVSATFMSFMQPMLDELGSNRQAWAALGKVASTVWNSVVFDAVNGTKHVDEVRRLLAGRDESAVAEFLIDLKLKLFGSHQWLVGHWEFYDDADGNPRLRVEARAVTKA